MRQPLRTSLDGVPEYNNKKSSFYSKPLYVIITACLTIFAISILSDFMFNHGQNEVSELLQSPESNVGDVLEGYDESVEAWVGIPPTAPRAKHVQSSKSSKKKKSSKKSSSHKTGHSTKKKSTKHSSSSKSSKSSHGSKAGTASKKTKSSSHSHLPKLQPIPVPKQTIHHTVSILYYKPYSSLLSRAEKIAKEISLRNEHTQVVLTPYDRWVDVNELLELEKKVDCFLGIGVSGQLLMQKLNKVVVTREPSCVDADINYQGGTMGTLITTSIAGCKKACVALEGCEFWSSHPRDKTKDTDYVCSLKSEKKHLQKKQGYISGPKECPHSIYQKLDNKHEMIDFEFVKPHSKHFIHQIPTLYVTNETDVSVVRTFMNKHKYEKYILKQENGAGANKMQVVTKAIEATKVQFAHGGFFVMQPFIWPHKQLSANFIAYEGKVEGIILADCDGGQNPEIMVKLGYMCAIIPENSWYAPKMKRFVEAFVKHNHVSGMMGMDFMLAGPDLYLLEVNPRVTGIESLIDKRGASIYWDRILSRYFEHCGIPMKKDGAPYKYFSVKNPDTHKFEHKLYASPWWYYYVKAMTKKAYLPALQRKMNKFVATRKDSVLIDIFQFEPTAAQALESICFECKLVMDFILNGHDGPPTLNLFGARSATDLRTVNSEVDVADNEYESHSEELLFSDSPEDEEYLEILRMMEDGVTIDKDTLKKRKVKKTKNDVYLIEDETPVDYNESDPVSDSSETEDVMGLIIEEPEADLALSALFDDSSISTAMESEDEEIDPFDVGLLDDDDEGGESSEAGSDSSENTGLSADEHSSESEDNSSQNEDNDLEEELVGDGEDSESDESFSGDEEEDILKRNVSFDEAVNADVEAELAIGRILNNVLDVPAEN